MAIVSKLGLVRQHVGTARLNWASALDSLGGSASARLSIVAATALLAGVELVCLDETNSHFLLDNPFDIVRPKSSRKAFPLNNFIQNVDFAINLISPFVGRSIFE